ncbi:putative E3 ubiquitin-protein ligase RHA1B [Cocos nucifera]|uniref:Putative E3 ubiquitin-protein ligase RHA1B n=1 Tax=Cocos nucifera TaxID=13894 RepID=A0A8K0ILT1_COCNU|nr:putative E3 ubiquitin-protein ligase RHA1B [Cocos nucifera]
MGFHLGGCYVPVPEPLILLLKFLDYIRFAVSLILFYLGLYPSSVPPTPYRDPEFHPTPASDDQSSISIKAQLPAVEFVSFVERSAGRWESMCVVCLENLAAGDEVRELGNCRHAFHKGCIDRWVDVGQVTCPLCRAQLLPCKERDPEIHPASDVPWPVTSISIKAQLPAVEFASFIERSAGRWEHGREFMCVVCLENLAVGDEVRELGNCRHAFHKGCIDRWVDVGQVTCPLCRAQLLPCKGWEDSGFWARIR